jgi:septin family protein
LSRPWRPLAISLAHIKLTHPLLFSHFAFQSKIPFAIVGSDTVLPSSVNPSLQVRGRRYPWGVVEVDNEDHCDFVKLRQMLIRTHMEELREHTNDVLYERYRSEKLLTMGVAQDQSVFREIKYVALSSSPLLFDLDLLHRSLYLCFIRSRTNIW